METYSVDIDCKRSVKGSKSYQIFNGNIMFSRIKMALCGLNLLQA